MKRLGLCLGLLALLSGCSSGEDSASTIPAVQAPPSCDAAKNPCAATVAGTDIRLTLAPPVKPLTPFALRVELQPGQDTESVMVDFSMAGMDMGENRYRLKNTAGNTWEGEAMLPVCASGITEWLADVTVTSAERTRRAQFRFFTTG